MPKTKKVKETKNEETSLVEDSDELLDFSDEDSTEEELSEKVEHLYKFSAGIKPKVIHDPKKDKTLIESVNGVFSTSDPKVMKLLKDKGYQLI